jgi:hypothetical protein
MKKRQFRIVHYKKGFIDLYKPQVKFWFGWRNFYANNYGSIDYCLVTPNNDKRWSYDIIKNYRMAKGLTKDQIEITEYEKNN